MVTLIRREDEAEVYGVELAPQPKGNGDEAKVTVNYRVVGVELAPQPKGNGDSS